ncbi:MAG: RusA family crossover junction endodeoxyribonuclease [Candidatus Binatia bacterium]|nr:RusA family crossover junction endodeoxyribonuclease [Candidatus Binatia bacterium]
MSRPSNELYFIIPLTPPSVNHYVKHTRTGHHFVTKEATAFKEAVWVCAARQKIRAKAYEVEVKIMLGKGQKGDLDNFAKCLLDGLVDAGVIDSDAKITRLILSKERSQSDGFTAVTVRGF